MRAQTGEHLSVRYAQTLFRLPQRVRNSTKLPVLSTLKSMGMTSTENVWATMVAKGHDVSQAAVRMALMRYAKQGLLFRVREDRVYLYRCTSRGLAVLDYYTGIKVPERPNHDIDFLIKLMRLAVVNGDYSEGTLTMFLNDINVKLLTTHDLVPRTERLLRLLRFYIARLRECQRKLG